MKHFLLLVCGLAFCMSLGRCQLCCNSTTEAQCKDTCKNCTSKDDWCCYGLSSQGRCQLCCNSTKEAQCKDTCKNCTSKDDWCCYGLSSQGGGNFSADCTFHSQNMTVTMILKNYNINCCKSKLPNEGSFMKVSPLFCLTLLAPWFAQLL